jgi:glucose/mannose-6-phosphate isomerase
MQDILDNENVISQRDPFDALGAAAGEYEQLGGTYEIEGSVHSKKFANVVVAGMGGSALAADLLKDWLNLDIPFEVVKTYDLPAYVGEQTLVISSSYSGNTEETLSALQQAIDRGATVAVVASGGKLYDKATELGIAHVKQPKHLQPRMAALGGLMSTLTLLEAYGLTHGKLEEIRGTVEWLKTESERWVASVPTEYNLAKQLAAFAAGKIPVIYAPHVMRSIAYKWKISFNESSKNVAFWNVLPEFSHNEFIGWSSHPVEKPFAVFDLRSDFEHERISQRFELTDRLLSGMRPKAQVVELEGESLIREMLWGSILADFTSIYLGILNGVEPSQVELVEKLKRELG